MIPLPSSRSSAAADSLLCRFIREQSSSTESFSLKIARKAAEKFNIHLADVEKKALEAGCWPLRYLRNRESLSCGQQLRLLYSRIAVIGCGGLGGFVIEPLARIGIGELILIDPDCFCEHNLNRQILCTVEDIGKAKVKMAGKRLAAINPAVRVKMIQAGFAEQHPSLKAVNLIIDCLDSLEARRELAAFCAEQKIPLVHGAVSGWYGQVSVFKGEKHRQGMNRLYPQSAAAVQQVSALSVSVAATASIQVTETLKILLELPSPLEHGFLHLDLLDLDFELAARS